jgi:hypothetical protein
VQSSIKSSALAVVRYGLLPPSVGTVCAESRGPSPFSERQSREEPETERERRLRGREGG